LTVDTIETFLLVWTVAGFIGLRMTADRGAPAIALLALAFFSGPVIPLAIAFGAAWECATKAMRIKQAKKQKETK
jgi:hypothetical protein